MLFFRWGNSVNGNQDILKFAFTLNVFYLGTKHAIILMFSCILLFSIDFSAMKVMGNCTHEHFTKVLEMHCFKRRLHKVTQQLCLVMVPAENLNSQFWLQWILTGSSEKLTRNWLHSKHTPTIHHLEVRISSKHTYLIWYSESSKKLISLTIIHIVYWSKVGYIHNKYCKNLLNHHFYPYLHANLQHVCNITLEYIESN